MAYALLTRVSEGQFCGYRNIQMLSSYIIASEMPGSEHFLNKVPSIFDLQDAIEAAWRQGIRPDGLAETGGIKGTRKFIGTPEVSSVAVLGLNGPTAVVLTATTGRSTVYKLWDSVSDAELPMPTGCHANSPKVSRSTSFGPARGGVALRPCCKLWKHTFVKATKRQNRVPPPESDAPPFRLYTSKHQVGRNPMVSAVVVRELNPLPQGIR